MIECTVIFLITNIFDNLFIFLFFILNSDYFQGRGDVKKKGKPDPYAYIPITHKTLNKRKASKSKSVFANVVKAAKKGASKGSKYKVKEVKKLMEGMKM